MTASPLRPASPAALLMAVSLIACSGDGAGEPPSGSPSAAPPADVTGELRAALTFHASFDGGPDADRAQGDPTIRTAPSYDALDQAVPGLGNPDVDLAAAAGRFGDALRFAARNQHAIYYQADGNVAYSGDGWSGTISFWLSLDPATDLEPGFSDPIQITDAAYNDAAIWVDFTPENPRQFRLGVFGDLDVWNPDGLGPDANPAFDDRLVVVDSPPFARDTWTHVVITHTALGTDRGTATLYLDGDPIETRTGIPEPFTWQPGRGAIRLGVNYVGLLDDLSVYSRALTDDEVRLLHALEGGAGELHD